MTKGKTFFIRYIRHLAPLFVGDRLLTCWSVELIPYFSVDWGIAFDRYSWSHCDPLVSFVCRNMKYGSDSRVILELYELGLIFSCGNRLLRTVTWLLSKSLSISPQKSPTCKYCSLDIPVIITLNCSTNSGCWTSCCSDSVVPICFGKHNWTMVCLHPTEMSAMAL